MSLAIEIRKLNHGAKRGGGGAAKRSKGAEAKNTTIEAMFAFICKEKGKHGIQESGLDLK